jgi:hypothetical protein
MPRAIFSTCLALIGIMASACATLSAQSANNDQSERVIASSTHFSNLVLPEGITSYNNHIYIGAYNVITPSAPRIFVFDTEGQLINEIGGNPGEQLVGSGALLGLTIDQQNGHLYVAAISTARSCACRV